MTARSNIKNTNKSFTATLALFVSVAVIYFFVTGCGSKTNKITLTTLEDTIAYTMGSMQNISYKSYVESQFGVDSTYRDICFEGIEKGYRDTKHKIAYFDGVSVGNQVMSYYVQTDSSLRNNNFVDGMVDAVLNKGMKTSFKNDTDSKLYSKGYDNSRMLSAYISGLKYEGNVLNEFVEGFTEGAKSVGIPEKFAYTCGLVFGGSRLNKAYNNLNVQIYGNDTTKTLSRDLFLMGLKESNDSNALIQHKFVKEIYTKADLKIKERMYSDNKAEGIKFLQENSKKSGVITLEDGLQYKIIKEGKGNVPEKKSNVEVHYRGMTIDGKVFEDSHESLKPVKMNVGQLIPGFSKALQMMPEGSKWEIFIPQELAYGSFQSKVFKPFSTLIFEIELIKIDK